MFHFIGKNLWITVASLAIKQIPENTGFDKGTLSVEKLLDT